MSPRDVDVLVVGGGPAGSAAALSVLRARPGCSVAVCERGAPGRDKVCGDGVAAEALDLLAGLGVREAAGTHPAIHRLTLEAGAARVDGATHRPGYVVPRAEFDATLLAAAQDAGAEVVRHRIRLLRRTSDGVSVDGRWRARVVVGADGVHSAVRGSLGLARQPARHTAFALRGYAPVLPGLADRQHIVFAQGGAPAYAWSFPLGDGRANVGYGELGGRAVTRQALLAGLEALIPGASRDGTGWRAAHLPLSSVRPRQPDGPVLLAGDAASLVNPLTGEGIYYAVRSGQLAGVAAVAALVGHGDAGRGLRRLLRRELGIPLAGTALAAPLVRYPWAVRSVLRAGARSPAVFDDLLRIGLADGRIGPRVGAAVARELLAELPALTRRRQPR